MKIVAQKDGGYLVEMSEQELAQLCGFSGTYGSAWESFLHSRGVRSTQRFPMIGAQFPVGEWWNLLQKIQGHEQSLKNIGEHLRGLAALIDGSWPAITMQLPTEKKDPAS